MGKLRELFGQKVKYFRLKKNFSERDFSNFIGVSAQQLLRIEKGINFPKCDVLEKIIEILNVEPFQLFDFELNDKEISFVEALKYPYIVIKIYDIKLNVYDIEQNEEKMYLKQYFSFMQIVNKKQSPVLFNINNEKFYVLDLNGNKYKINDATNFLTNIPQDMFQSVLQLRKNPKFRAILELALRTLKDKKYLKELKLKINEL